MGHERAGTQAEQLSWEAQLAEAVDDKAGELVLLRAHPGLPLTLTFDLKAPDRSVTRITAAVPQDMWWMRPRDLQEKRPRSPRLELEDGTIVGLTPGASAAVGHRATEALQSRYRHDTRMSFSIDSIPGPSDYAVSASGEVTSVVDVPQLGMVKAHYEAFDEADGLQLYKLGEDSKLYPVDQLEGNHLLWQVTKGESP